MSIPWLDLTILRAELVLADPNLWYENETDPAQRSHALLAHGNSHRKRVVEGPQLCHRMKPVQPEVIRGNDFVAVKTTYKYEYASPGRMAGSR